MHVDLLFPSKYLKAADLGGQDRVVVIKRLDAKHKMKMAGGASTQKPILWLEGEAKMLALNKTNGKSIAKVYGPETDNWVGKAIVLFPTTTTFGGDTVDCIRVREVEPRPRERQPPADPFADEPPHDPANGEVQQSEELTAALQIIAESDPELAGVADRLKALNLQGKDRDAAKQAYLNKLQAGS